MIFFLNAYHSNKTLMSTNFCSEGKTLFTYIKGHANTSSIIRR